MEAVKEAEPVLNKSDLGTLRNYFGNASDWVVAHFGAEWVKKRIGPSGFGVRLAINFGGDVRQLPACCGAGIVVLESQRTAAESLKDSLFQAKQFGYRIVFAIINEHQEDWEPLLTGAGFKCIQPWVLNSNSSNKIATYMYTFPVLEVEKRKAEQDREEIYEEEFEVDF